MTKLWKSTFVVSAMTLFSRIFGFIRDVVIMQVFGASALMDAFLVAFRIPNFFRRLFSEGAFSQAFVPILTEYKTKQKLTDVQLLISNTSGALLVIVSLLTVFVMLAAPAVTFLFASGFEDVKFDHTANMLRITFPYLVCISLTAFAASILNTYNHFATPAFAPILLNISIIVAALYIAPILNGSIQTLAWAVLIGGVFQFAIQIPALWRRNLLVPPQLDFKHEGVIRIFKLMLPALFALSVTQLNLLVNTIFASYMQDGSVAWLYTAERMSELPLGIIGTAIATVILPSLSRLQTTQDTETFKRTLDWAIRIILLVGLPASIGLYILSHIIMESIFMQGQFMHKDATMSGYALKALALGVLAFMLIKVLAPAFFAKQDTKTPVRVGAYTVITNIILSILLTLTFKYILHIESLHVALALSSSIAAMVNAGLLYYFLHKHGYYKLETYWKRTFLQFAIANVTMIITLMLITKFFPQQETQAIRILYMVGFCITGATAYAIALLLAGFKLKQLKLNYNHSH